MHNLSSSIIPKFNQLPKNKQTIIETKSNGSKIRMKNLKLFLLRMSGSFYYLSIKLNFMLMKHVVWDAYEINSQLRWWVNRKGKRFWIPWWTYLCSCFVLVKTAQFFIRWMECWKLSWECAWFWVRAVFKTVDVKRHGSGCVYLCM